MQSGGGGGDLGRVAQRALELGQCVSCDDLGSRCSFPSLPGMQRLAPPTAGSEKLLCWTSTEAPPPHHHHTPPLSAQPPLPASELLGSGDAGGAFHLHRQTTSLQPPPLAPPIAPPPATTQVMAPPCAASVALSHHLARQCNVPAEPPPTLPPAAPPASHLALLQAGVPPLGSCTALPPPPRTALSADATQPPASLEPPSSSCGYRADLLSSVTVAAEQPGTLPRATDARCELLHGGNRVATTLEQELQLPAAVGLGVGTLPPLRPRRATDDDRSGGGGGDAAVVTHVDLLPFAAVGVGPLPSLRPHTARTTLVDGGRASDAMSDAFPRDSAASRASAASAASRASAAPDEHRRASSPTERRPVRHADHALVINRL